MSHGGAGRAGRARSQLKKRGAWGQEWATKHGAMGPWGYGAMSHEQKNARRAEGASMHWGPFILLKSAYQERGMEPGSMGP